VLPFRDHARLLLLFPGQAGQRLVDPSEVGGPPVSLGQAHAGQQGADRQLPGAHADGEQCLDPRRDAGAVDDLLQRRQRDHDCRDAPSSRTASASPAGSSPATRSPRRWEQEIPAACMNVASPSSPAASRGQVARSRLVSSRAARPRRPALSPADWSGSGGRDQSRTRPGCPRRTRQPRAAARGSGEGPGPCAPVRRGPAR
jgi:hypothetical protein